MGEHAYAHVPVMAGRITALLLPALTGPTPGGRPPVLIDATLGRAGHARAFLDAVPGLLPDRDRRRRRPRSRPGTPSPSATRAG